MIFTTEKYNAIMITFIYQQTRAEILKKNALATS